MIVGAHVSIAGGLDRAIERAAAHRMTGCQVFLRTPRAWRSRRLTDADVRRFHAARAGSEVRVVIAHAMYLINPASPDRAHRRRSERVLVDDLRRCERLGIPWLVLHPGSHGGTDAAAGVRRAGRVLGRALDATRGARAGLLVENTAGSGDTLGADFGEIAAVMAVAGGGPRLGMCLDTAHAFAAGHDLATGPGWSAARRALGRTVGLRRVRAVHVNDSASALGSRVDRHASLGVGRMGLEPFRRLVHDPTLGRLPLLLETPKAGPDGEDLDARNLELLRSLKTGPAR